MPASGPLWRLQASLCTAGLALCLFFAFQDRVPVGFIRRVALPRDEPNGETNEIHSTCSQRADRRGFHQKVIAYSLYGNLSRPDMVERYVKPLAASAAAAGVWYPGWIVRIYHDAGADDDDGAALERRFGRLAHVDLCPVRRVLADRRLRDPFAMTWRFLPLLDPLVDRLMSRDADSPLLPREVDAVRQWIASNRTFHIMRDHVGHCVPMLGGLWGVQLRNPQRSELELVARKMLTKYHRHEIGVDQSLLQRYIWPLAMKDSMAHDSYCCAIFASGQPFPTRRQGRDYLGMVASFNGSAQPLPDCPVRCRPAYGLDWQFC